MMENKFRPSASQINRSHLSASHLPLPHSCIFALFAFVDMMLWYLAVGIPGFQDGLFQVSGSVVHCCCCSLCAGSSMAWHLLPTSLLPSPDTLHFCCLMAGLALPASLSQKHCCCRQTSLLRSLSLSLFAMPAQHMPCSASLAVPLPASALQENEKGTEWDR